MAGLLDMFNSDDGMQAMGLLAAAAPSMAPQNFAGRLAQAGNTYKQLKEDQLKQQYIKSQINENAAQSDMRRQQLMLSQRTMDMQNNLLGIGNPQASPMPQFPQMPGSIATAPTQQPMGSTDATASVMPLGSVPTPQQQATMAQMPPAPPQVQSKLDELSTKYKIPVEALKYDVVFNGGKGIAEMVNKRGTPDMQVSGNYAYDKNKLQSGFMPSLNISTTGQASLVTPNADGSSASISAPQGALDTYRSYKDADAGKKPMKVYNPATGREEYTTEKAVVDAAGGLPSSATSPGAWQQANPGKSPMAAQSGDTDMQRVLPEALAQAKQRLSQAKTPEDINRATSDINGIQGEMKKSGIAMPSNFAAGPSIAEKQAADATGKFTSGRAENIVKYEDGLNSRVNEGANLNMRLQESLKTMDNFTNGGGKETRAKLAQMAQAIGAPDKVVNGIAGGDLASMQEFNKISVQQAMESLKQSMGGAGRITQAEFKVFQVNNPNLDTDSRAVRKIFDFNTRVFQRDLAEQQAFNKHVDSGGDPAKFPLAWSGDQASAGFTNPNLSAKLTEKPPAPMKGMTRGGYKFKGGDASSPSNWEKQ